LKVHDPFFLIDMVNMDTFPLPLSLIVVLISWMCLVPEMAYHAVLSPVAASISLSCPVSFSESELTDQTLTLVLESFLLKD